MMGQIMDPIMNGVMIGAGIGATVGLTNAVWYLIFGSGYVDWTLANVGVANLGGFSAGGR